MKVKISKIAEEIDCQPDESSMFYNTEDGEVYLVSDYEMHIADDDDPVDNLPEWQKEQIQLAKQIIAGDQYIRLPDKWDIHEYSIMEKFCLKVADPKVSEALQVAIQGKGAFRRFRDVCHRFKVIDQWYSYKAEALKEVAIAWCEDHNLEYEE